jgi:hypothetical protein
MSAIRIGKPSQRRPLLGGLYRGIAGVQRETGGLETTVFRGFGKAAAEGISSAARSGWGRRGEGLLWGDNLGNQPFTHLARPAVDRTGWSWHDIRRTDVGCCKFLVARGASMDL